VTRAAAISLAALAACAAPEGPPERWVDAAPRGVDVLEGAADPAVVTDPSLRAAIDATGLPWRVRHRRSGMELLLVPPMGFERGAALGDEEAADDERPAHAAAVTAPFYLGRHEVTAAEWEAVTGERPGFFSAVSGDAAPIESVSYFAAQDFAAAAGLQLPTESQWEAACRAGGQAARHGPLDEVAWHRGNAGGRPHPVGGLAPNALGFHDMLGNVWEWTRSGYVAEEYARRAGALATEPLDARGYARGTPRTVLRGGSWFDPPKRARASARYATERDLTAGHVGLRAALELDAPAAPRTP
jgi:formylglycine-generating enzyme required for sulfatase activity